MQRFCQKLGIRLYRPTYRFLRGDPEKQAKAKEELADLRAQAEAGELVLLSKDEARFPMVPTHTATLSVKNSGPTTTPETVRTASVMLAVLKRRICSVIAKCYVRPKDRTASAGL